MSLSLKERIARAGVVLSDLDGCLTKGNVPLPGAAELAERLGEKLYIVTNNSTNSPENLAEELAGHGFRIAPERLLLAGATMVDRVARTHPGAMVRFNGTPALRTRALRAGLMLIDEGQPDLVLLSRDLDFSYQRLQDISLCLEGGAKLVVANPDLTHPGQRGAGPETGALLAAVLACVPKGRDFSYEVIGKPEAAIYLEALARAGKEPSEAVMLGDNPKTDIAGAEALGMASIMVGDLPGAVTNDLYDLIPD